jgi:hypothetical protein
MRTPLWSNLRGRASRALPAASRHRALGYRGEATCWRSNYTKDAPGAKNACSPGCHGPRACRRPSRIPARPLTAGPARVRCNRRRHDGPPSPWPGARYGRTRLPRRKDAPGAAFDGNVLKHPAEGARPILGPRLRLPLRAWQARRHPSAPRWFRPRWLRASDHVPWPWGSPRATTGPPAAPMSLGHPHSQRQTTPCHGHGSGWRMGQGNGCAAGRAPAPRSYAPFTGCAHAPRQRAAPRCSWMRTDLGGARGSCGTWSHAPGVSSPHGFRGVADTAADRHMGAWAHGPWRGHRSSNPRMYDHRRMRTQPSRDPRTANRGVTGARREPCRNACARRSGPTRLPRAARAGGGTCRRSRRS